MKEAGVVLLFVIERVKVAPPEHEGIVVGFRVADTSMSGPLFPV
jgi:hypothetical protein